MHVGLRGHNRQPLFDDPRDRSVVLRYIEEALPQYAGELHAYVLMTNHVHLLVTGTRPGALSRFMHGWSRRYAFYFNRSRGRSGAVFERRFWSEPVKSDYYFIAAMRYIESNPVRARLRSHPSDWPWSSHQQNAGGDPRAPLTPHPVYLALGRSVAARGEAYRRLFDTPQPDLEIEMLRAAARPRPRGKQPGTSTKNNLVLNPAEAGSPPSRGSPACRGAPARRSP